MYRKNIQFIKRYNSDAIDISCGLKHNTVVGFARFWDQTVSWDGIAL
jgi:hypothetical protein